MKKLSFVLLLLIFIPLVAMESDLGEFLLHIRNRNAGSFCREVIEDYKGDVSQLTTEQFAKGALDKNREWLEERKQLVTLFRYLKQNKINLTLRSLNNNELGIQLKTRRSNQSFFQECNYVADVLSGKEEIAAFLKKDQTDKEAKMREREEDDEFENCLSSFLFFILLGVSNK